MGAVDDFKQFVSDAEAGTQYAKWAKDNPGDLARWHDFRDAVLTGQAPPPPAMTTPHGRELIDAAVETGHYRQLEQQPAPAPQPVPPVTPFTTNVTSGEAITPPFAWQFTPPSDAGATAGYFFADGNQLAKVTGAGPYAHTLGAGELADGSHQLGHAWDCADGSHASPSSAYPVTVSNPAPAPTPTPTGVALPTFECLVVPNSTQAGIINEALMYEWFRPTSPTTPWKSTGGEGIQRNIRFPWSGPDANGVPAPTLDTWWILFEFMPETLVLPDGTKIDSWAAHDGFGDAYILDIHSLGGDVGWYDPWEVSPVLLSGGQLDLPHNGPTDKGSGQTRWTVPNPPRDIYTSIVVALVAGRVDGTTPSKGRVRVWLNSEDGSLKSSGGPQIDTGPVNTVIDALTPDTVGHTGLQKNLAIWQGGPYIAQGFVDTKTPGLTSNYEVVPAASIQEYQFPYRMVAARVGQTLEEALADTGISNLTAWEFSKHLAGTQKDFGASRAAQIASRATADFILPGDLA